MQAKYLEQCKLGGLFILSMVVNIMVVLGVFNRYCWFWNIVLLLVGLLLLANDSSPIKKEVNYPMCILYLGWACSVLLAIRASF